MANIVFAAGALFALGLCGLANADNPGQGAYYGPINAAPIGQGGYSSAASDLYTSPLNSKIDALPSGALNVMPGKMSSGSDDTVWKPYTTTGEVGPVSNTLGCGGVGQGEFASGLMNMPEVFGKFQEDINSVLAKQLMSLNYAMPQSSAIFSQLNTLVNQRYDQFQRACSLDELKKNARDQYLKACVEKLTPTRQSMIETTNNALPSSQQLKEAQISAMAYAQAWEVCQNQYVSSTVALEVRNDVLTKFAEKTRELENITEALRPVLCPFKKDSNSDSEEGCWQMMLLPQVRTCLDPSLEGGCGSDVTDYGVKSPQISAVRLMDIMRDTIDELLISRRVEPFHGAVEALKKPEVTIEQAGADAAAVISSQGLFRFAAGYKPSSLLSQSADASSFAEASVADFQYGFLNCKETKPMLPLETFASSFKALEKDAKDISLTAFAVSDMDIMMNAIALQGVSAEDKQSVRSMLYTAIGCTANKSIPIFDPNIFANMQNRCDSSDRAAFYAMAGYDVSLVATRDVLRYLNIRLKQAYGRLLTEQLAPVSATQTAGSVSPTVSPELNKRLAGVVKEIMIPYVEEQITRLNELDAKRGDFGQRVQQIYKAKSGCVGSRMSTGKKFVQASSFAGGGYVGGGGGGGGGGGH